MLAYKLDWKVADRIAKTVCHQAAIDRDDKEDFIQDVLAEMMERARRDSGGLSTEEMWRAAECVRSRYWRTYKKASRTSSLNELIPDTKIEFIETVADDKALDLDAALDAKSRLDELPPGIVFLGKKLERGDPLTANQRLYLARFRKGEPETKAKRRKANYDTYHRLCAQGLCAKCGKETGKFAYCPECRQKNRKYQQEHTQNTRVWENALIKHWRKQGRCPRCGTVPEPGYKLCSRCLARSRKNHHDRTARRGICPGCGATPEPGFKTCLACRVKNRKYVAACRNKRVSLRNNSTTSSKPAAKSDQK